MADQTSVNPATIIVLMESVFLQKAYNLDGIEVVINLVLHGVVILHLVFDPFIEELQGLFSDDRFVLLGSF